MKVYSPDPNQVRRILDRMYAIVTDEIRDAPDDALSQRYAEIISAAISTYYRLALTAIQIGGEQRVAVKHSLLDGIEAVVEHLDAAAPCNCGSARQDDDDDDTPPVEIRH